MLLVGLVTPAGMTKPPPPMCVPLAAAPPAAGVEEVVVRVRDGGAGLAYAGGGPIPKLRSASGRGESSTRPDIIALIRPLPFASVAIEAGFALTAAAGAGGDDRPTPSASTNVVEASNDSRFRSL